MLVSTHHSTVLGKRLDGTLFQIMDIRDLHLAFTVSDTDELRASLNPSVPDVAIRELPFSHIFLSQNGAYASAIPDGTIEINRAAPGHWETFRLVPTYVAHSMLSGQGERLARRVVALTAAGQPIKLHFACGLFPIEGFLNIDLGIAAPQFLEEHPDDYFAFPTVGVPLPLDDNSVDFIFHEDFIEHIDQLSQIQFLAETRRVMKPGAVHRVNTPELLWTMREHSQFDLGFEGVYIGERYWDHINILSKKNLEEISYMIGYSDVQFNLRGQSISPHAIPDRRPYSDRDEVDGNIFADLVK